MQSDRIAMVRQSLERLRPDAVPVINLFYMRLFAIAPAVRALFPDDMIAQNDKFADMIATATGLVDDPARLEPLLAELGRRHRAYGADPRHYALVEEALLWALERHLGPDFTGETREAWRAFYRSLADRMLKAAA